ncbi:UNVERIFIED_CONTAM: putative protein S-acyltransferase 14 [Sesamum indicum]
MAWNVFKFCTALRGLGSIMILLVLAVVGVSYYAVVITNYGPALAAGGLHSLLAFAVAMFQVDVNGSFEFAKLRNLRKASLQWLNQLECFSIFRRINLLSSLFNEFVDFDKLVCYNLVMLLWSYFSVVFTDPGCVPPSWRPALDEERGDTNPLTLAEFPADAENRRIRFCRKCNQFKPPRCHHCSVCERCVLKMDHHCVWVVNCVGALNYKYFLLFLFYTFLETSLVGLSLLPDFIAFFSDGEISGTPGTLATSFLAFVLNLAFSLSVLGFLIMHISLVAANTTTIEVFGTDKTYWFIPAYSEEDLCRMPALNGLESPSKPDLDAPEF